MIIAKTRECQVTELHSKLAEMVKMYIGSDNQVLYCSETAIGVVPKRSAQIITQERLISVKHDPLDRDAGTNAIELTNIGDVWVKSPSITYSYVNVHSNKGNQSILAEFGSKQAADRFAAILRQAMEKARTKPQVADIDEQILLLARLYKNGTLDESGFRSEIRLVLNKS